MKYTIMRYPLDGWYYLKYSNGDKVTEPGITTGIPMVKTFLTVDQAKKYCDRQEQKANPKPDLFIEEYEP